MYHNPKPRWGDGYTALDCLLKIRTSCLGFPIPRLLVCIEVSSCLALSFTGLKKYGWEMPAGA